MQTVSLGTMSLAIAAIGGIAPMASAGVVAVEQERSVSYFHQAGIVGEQGEGLNVNIDTTTATEGLGMFDPSDADWATHTSNIQMLPSGMRIQAEGGAKLWVPDVALGRFDDRRAGSQISMTFELTEAMNYNLVGMLGKRTFSDHTARITSTFELTGPGGFSATVATPYLLFGGENQTTLDREGVLEAGVYTLEVFATVAANQVSPGTDGDAISGEASFDFDLELTAVPTPGSMGLLGLAGLVAIRRNR